MPMNPRLLRPRAAPSTGFDPRTIADLELWLDASNTASHFVNDDGTTASVSAGDQVGYWADLSGKGRHATQSIANNRPTVSASPRNGRRVLTFDGSNDQLTFTSITNSRTVFAVLVAVTGTPSLSGLIGTLGGANSIGIRRHTSTAQYRGVGNTNEGDFTNGAGGVFRVNGVSTNANSLNTWHVVTAVAPANRTLTELSYDNVFSRGLRGDVAEILVYGRALTVSERDSVELALGAKWGLTIG